MKNMLIATVMGLSLAAANANAVSLPVVNAGFDDPSQVLENAGGTLGPWSSTAVGWTVSNGTGGTFDPVDSVYPSLASDERVGWSNGGILSQVTTSVFQADTNYTLSVDIGKRVGTSFGFGTIELFAGNSIVNTVKELALTTAPASGTFVTTTLTVAAVDIVPFIGQTIGILLNADRAQTNFDNVSLTASAVPLPPAALAFASVVAGAGYISRRRKRKQEASAMATA